jgi:hypothetical protein
VLSGGLAIPVYIVAWIILPRDDRPPAAYGGPPTHDWPHELHVEAEHLADEARRMAADLRGATPGWHASEPYSTPPPGAYTRRHRSTGVVLVVLGVLLLAANAGVFRFIDWNLLWPLIFIGLGLALLARQSGVGR